MPCYDYPRPAVTVDVAVFRGSDDAREVLLVKRGQEPFAGTWALPGGFVDEGERLPDAALRELREETGLAPRGRLIQVGAYGDPGRDPRGWTVGVAFAVVLDPGEDGPVRAGDDAAEAAWMPADGRGLAFDHDSILSDALARVASST
jgi:8-oxo-dGTP diphosphatase